MCSDPQAGDTPFSRLAWNIKVHHRRPETHIPNFITKLKAPACRLRLALATMLFRVPVPAPHPCEEVSKKLCLVPSSSPHISMPYLDKANMQPRFLGMIVDLFGSHEQKVQESKTFCDETRKTHRRKWNTEDRISHIIILYAFLICKPREMQLIHPHQICRCEKTGH